MFGMIKNLLKMLTNKKVLVVLAIAAVAGGVFLYMKSQKAVTVQDVDQESSIEQQIVESVMTMTPESLEAETQDLSQAPMPMPAVPESTESSTENFEIVGASPQDNFAPL